MNQDVTLRGLCFRCRLDGPEGAPWMVFSNSLATDLSLWDAQVAHFGARYRCLRYDQRGHGGTEVPPGPATLTELADDAAALMEHFGVQQAVFVGVSMGAATGFGLAARLPGRIARLVASDGQAATAAGGAAAWEERIALLQQQGMDAFADATVARWFAAASRAEGNPAVATVRAMVAAMPKPGVIACMRALQAYDVRPGLPAIRQPTLLVAGAEDGAMPQVMQGIQGVIAGAQYMEIAGAGHLPCIERPAAFNAVLERFLG